MTYKTLVLDANYVPINFVGLSKLTRMYFNDKLEIISEWDTFLWKNLKYPAVVRLKKYIRTKKIKAKFSFKGVARRDRYICQYTGTNLSKENLTIDHIIPKSRGGKSSWKNCVCASKSVNRIKANKTPEEAGLELLHVPKEPINYTAIEYYFIKDKHPDWTDYIKED
jgi:5-methylcytosine-specific restriction endonuclease McrA